MTTTEHNSQRVNVVGSEIESNATVKFHKQKQDKQDEWSSLLQIWERKWIEEYPGLRLNK